MAPNNTDNNEHRRQESSMAQEANDNTDSSRNNVDDGKVGGHAGQKVVNYELFFFSERFCLFRRNFFLVACHINSFIQLNLIGY